MRQINCAKALSETLLIRDINSFELFHKRYVVYTKNRFLNTQKSRAGVVLVVVDCGFKLSLLNINEENREELWMIVSLNGTNIIIGGA